ncbi:MAG: 1-deoxy-D-xylulose-5-phosphate synthase [Bacteroidales bacterium]|nr:1-deoxy-D-xylulose-5-phosphate synthase [Bacteroidales bacterium]
MEIKAGELLLGINDPSDLKKLKLKDLPQVCEELRSFIIEQVSMNPGHLGANLGAIELTVAMHYVFNTPLDNIVWDVGHQAYGHKILTGRRDQFHKNRTLNGIAGFPQMAESKYDAFGTGHSSTSISAALGMAVASSLQNDNDKHHIAVIGDGSMTGGMAMEALNNAGVSKSNLLVILNDNGIAISKNTGALKEYLTDITTSKLYNRVKDLAWKLMGGGTPYGKNSRALVHQFRSAFKSTILKKSNLFEAFNMRYFGPVDGHDVIHLVRLFRDLKNIKGPKLLHLITTKGKGFEMAEKDKEKFHAPGYFNKDTGEIITTSCNGKQAPKYQVVFGKTIVELAEMNEKIVGVTPAMPTGCSMDFMMNKMPERAFDVGIAEQHAVTFSAGLAAEGMMPFCNIYSTFMQRAYDQVIHDVALQNLNVVFCLDRGGLVGEDGATHHGAYDLAYFRAIPNLTIAAPMNEEELRDMMFTGQLPNKGPFAIRYPRGRGVMIDWKTPFKEQQIGKGRKIKDGKDVAIVSIGHPGNFVTEACEKLKAEGKDPAHFDMRYLKPIDEELLHEVFKNYNKIITVEDGTILGGLGSAVIEFMNDNNYNAHVERLGVPDKFIEQGTPEQLFHECGYDADGIVNAVKGLV